jgi:tRNA G18 (ribose-2'-O)-methylase SpoU
MKEPVFQIYQCVNPECRFRCPNDLTHRTMVRCPVCSADFLPSGQPFTNYRDTRACTITQSCHIEVVLDNLRSTLNVGSIFRTADGAGVRHIHCCGTTPTPKHPKIEKSGLGAEDFIGWTYHRSTLDLIHSLKQHGFVIICLEVTENSISVGEISRLFPAQKFVLVLGNEVSGIDPAVMEMADHVVAIPMLGRKTSLNVAVAFGIAIYALVI